MGVLSALAAAILTLAQAPPVESAIPPAETGSEEHTVDEVVVRGQRRSVEEFVRQNAAPTKRGRLARWDRNRKICPGVVGLPQKQAAYLVDRIALEAQTLTLDVAGPGCGPNIIVLVTNQADRAAEEMSERYRKFFADKPMREDLVSGGGRETLGQFVNTSRPVRWWHVAELTPADGSPMASVKLSADIVVPLIKGTGSSRLASKVKEDLSRVLIIVDTTQLKGLTYEALGSYLAMVSLAQLDPDAEPGGLPSILTLFRDRDEGLSPPESLTEWDRAYLAGLYQAPADARNLNAQKGAIRERLKKVDRR